MGCCVSTHDNKATQQGSQPHHQHQHQQFRCVSKSPPRPEEESVKEVLSETPNPKSRDPTPDFLIPLTVSPQTDYDNDEEEQHKLVPTKPRILLTPKKTRPTPPPTDPTHPDEISDLSELSETVSTNTLRDKEEDELQQVQQWSKINSRYRNISQGQNGHFIPNNRSTPSAGRSPAKRVDPSPPRRRNPSPVTRRDPGENSGRRSGSPGKVGRSQSGRRTGPSPGRVRMVHAPNERVVVEEQEEERQQQQQSRESDSEWVGPNESLENPLVSLECFIFL